MEGPTEGLVLHGRRLDALRDRAAGLTPRPNGCVVEGRQRESPWNARGTASA
jgi:hypothetical protein